MVPDIAVSCYIEMRFIFYGKRSKKASDVRRGNDTASDDSNGDFHVGLCRGVLPDIAP